MWFPTISIPPIPINSDSESRVTIQSNVSGDATVETHVVTSVNGVTTTIDRNTSGSLTVIATSGGTTVKEVPPVALQPTPPLQQVPQFFQSVWDSIRAQLYRLFHFSQRS